MNQEVLPKLDARSQQIFKLLISEYLQNGNKVSSRTLALKENIHLSSASVRKVLHNLEDQGYIMQDHTSSGRRPTVRGMRVYLGSLVRMTKPSDEQLIKFRSSLSTESTNVMAKSAIKMLSDLTGMISLVTLPSTKDTMISQIQFVQLSSTRLLAVLVTTEGEVRNRLIEIDKALSTRELEVAAAVFNERFAGHSLASAKLELRGVVQELEKNIALLLRSMIDKLTVEDGEPTRKFYHSGFENIYANSTLAQEAGRLQEMVNLMRNKEILLGLIDKGIKASDVSVFIGSESGVPELDEYSILTAPYEDEEGHVVGALGLIGPIRMQYEQIVPMMDVISELMSDAITKITKDYS